MAVRTDLPQDRIEASGENEHVRVDGRIYTRHGDGRWTYGDTGVPVPGARDRRLDDIYQPGTVINAAGEVEAVLIAMADADQRPELGWCIPIGTIVELGGRSSYLIDLATWERQAANRNGVWAPELHGTEPEKLAARAERDFRLAQHDADLAAARRGRAFEVAATQGLSRRAIASLVGLSPSRIQQVTDTSRGSTDFDPGDTEALFVLRMVASAPHIEIADLDGDSDEGHRSTHEAVRRLLEAGLVSFGRTKDSLVLTARGRSYVQHRRGPSAPSKTLKRSLSTAPREEVIRLAKPKFSPGDKAPVSGLYPLQGPRGGDQGVQVTVVQGRPLPPTPHPGMGYGKPDAAKHEK